MNGQPCGHWRRLWWNVGQCLLLLAAWGWVVVIAVQQWDGNPVKGGLVVVALAILVWLSPVQTLTEDQIKVMREQRACDRCRQGGWR